MKKAFFTFSLLLLSLLFFSRIYAQVTVRYDSQGMIDFLSSAFVFLTTGWGVFLGLLIYIYLALAFMTIAKKTNTEPAWLAWIPIANIYLMSKIAQREWWPILLPLLSFIPFIGFFALIAFFVFYLIYLWRIFKRVGRPGWWALVVFVPLVGQLLFLIFFRNSCLGQKRDTPALFFIVKEI